MNTSHTQQTKSAQIVMIVEDNPAIRNVVSWSLQLGGYEPVEVANGQEAINWLETAEKRQCYPTLILLDLAMPGMSGETFLQWLQETWYIHHPMLPVIIVTAGYADEKMAYTSVKQVITKPFHVRDLLEIIRRWAD